jgi:hypothetical protein
MELFNPLTPTINHNIRQRSVDMHAHTITHNFYRLKRSLSLLRGAGEFMVFVVVMTSVVVTVPIFVVTSIVVRRRSLSGRRGDGD